MGKICVCNTFFVVLAHQKVLDLVHESIATVLLTIPTCATDSSSYFFFVSILDFVTMAATN